MNSDTDGGRDGAPAEAKRKSARVRKRAYGDGSVFERKDGRWVAAVRHEGKRFVRYATPNTRKGAIETLRTLQRELAAGEVARPGQVTVADMATQWLDVLTTAGRSESTMGLYRRLLAWYVLPAVGRVRLRDLKPSHLQRLYARLLTEGRTQFGAPADVLPAAGWPAWQRPKRRYLPSLGKQVQAGLAPLTVAKVHAVMHQVCRLAVRYGYTTRNVAREVAEAGGVPRPRSPEQRPLSPAAVHALLASARERAAAEPGPTGAEPYLAAYHVLLDTGCRVGECAALRWGDVRLGGERPAVTVRARLANERVGPPEFRVPKTASTRRTMGITPGTADCLRDHLRRLTDFRAGRGLPPPGPEELVFPARPGVTKNPDGTDALPSRLLAWWVKRAALLAGLPPGIHAHQLRHTTATLLLKQRVPLPDVSRRLGHARRSTTLDLYAHVLEDDDAAAVAALTDVLAPPGAVARPLPSAGAAEDAAAEDGRGA